MEFTGWGKVAVIGFIALCGVIGLAAALFMLVQLISWIVDLLHMPG